MEYLFQRMASESMRHLSGTAPHSSASAVFCTSDWCDHFCASSKQLPAAANAAHTQRQWMGGWSVKGHEEAFGGDGDVHFLKLW